MAYPRSNWARRGSYPTDRTPKPGAESSRLRAMWAEWMPECRASWRDREAKLPCLAVEIVDCLKVRTASFYDRATSAGLQGREVLA
jgi:hypothetical protein